MNSFEQLSRAGLWGAVLCVAILVRCGKEEPSAQVSSIVFTPSQLVLVSGGSGRVSLKAGKQPYDFSRNELELTLLSDDPTVAAVTDDGEVRGGAVGCANITASSPDGDLSARMQVIVSFDFGRLLEPSNVYASKIRLYGDMAMQSFDLTKNGDLVIAGCEGPALYVQRCSLAGFVSDPMTIYYGGHATNISIEEQAGDVYVWTPNFATRYADGSYFGEQIVSRVKLEPGKTALPEECTDNYYVGPYRNLCVAADAASDLLCILFSDGTVPGRDTQVRVYRLSAAKAVPKSTVTLLEIKRGGETGAPTVAQTLRPQVSVHDLTTIEPLYEFYLDSSQLNGDMPFQGFGIARDRIYWCAGDGGRNNYGQTPPRSAVTELDLHGRIIRMRTPVAMTSDVGRLNDCGLTDTGYFEAEGVKIRDGRCYLGFITSAGQDGWKFRAHVLRVD